MNKVVRDIIPASELPERMRREFEPDADVLVTARSVTAADKPEGLKPDAAGHFGRFKDLRRPHFLSPGEVDRHVTALREEWERR